MPSVPNNASTVAKPFTTDRERIIRKVGGRSNDLRVNTTLSGGNLLPNVLVSNQTTPTPQCPKPEAGTGGRFQEGEENIGKRGEAGSEARGLAERQEPGGN